MSGKCPHGEIERVGYNFTRKKTNKKVSVDPTCVKDMGKPGKGEKLITIPEEDVGLLSKYGYTLKKGHEKRVESLKKAIKENSELKILKHVNALRTLQKSNEKLYNKLDKDMKWIQKDYLINKGVLDTDEKKPPSPWSTESKSSKNNQKEDEKKKPSPWSLVNFDKPDEKKTPSPWTTKNNQKDEEKKTPSPWSLVNFDKPDEKKTPSPWTSKEFKKSSKKASKKSSKKVSKKGSKKASKKCSKKW